jgi:hypothetical protein
MFLELSLTSSQTPQTKSKSDDIPAARAEQSGNKRSSTFLNAPQIPEQDPVTPMDESKWFPPDRDTSSTPPERMTERLTATSQPNLSREQDNEASAPKIGSAASSNSHPADAHQDQTGSLVTAAAIGAAAIPAVKIRSDSGDTSKADDQEITPTAAEQLATTNSAKGASHERKVSDLTDEDAGDIRSNQLQASRSLTAPDDRRLSAVSAVSSPSPSPVDDSQRDDAQHHSSPADDVAEEQQARDPAETVPSYEETAPVGAIAASQTKEEEAAQDRAAADVQNDPAPSYEETPSQNARAPRIGPNAQILPVANLTQQRRNEPVAVHSRPFSFEATDSFSRAQQAYEQSQQNQNAPSQPLSPVSQTASKDLSQVSVEEVPDDTLPRQNRQSKSYSRPFGADPVGNHPAFRQADQPIDRSQMYSTEATPANSRYVQQPRPVEEAGYRIPGPYGQEYRSPKPRQYSNQSPTTAHPRQQSIPNAAEAGHGPAPLPFSSQQQSQQPGPGHWQQQQQQSFPPGQGSIAPPMAPEQPKTKKTFGAFLRGKSKPQSAPGRPSFNEQEHFSGPASRPAMNTRGSRQDSVTSGQSSLGESRDVIGQLPPAEKSRNRLSRDPSKFSSGRASAEPPLEGKKKKRFSAMGNLFGRSDKSEKPHPPQRSTTLPSGTAQPDRGHYQYHEYGSQQRDQDSRYQYDAGGPAPAGGYLGDPQQDDYLSHNQHSQQKGYQVAPPQGYDSRPSDLRIDTSGQGRNVDQPATAPVQSYSRATHDSFQNGAPKGSYSATTAVTHDNSTYQGPPSTRAPLNGPSSIDPHVASLHKRSRSPTSAAAAAARGLESPEPGQNNAAAATAGAIDSLAPPDHSGRNSGGTPVDGLGTFSKHRISPVDGIPRSDEEQEAPFRIGIPGSEGEEGRRRRRTRQILIEQGRFVEAKNLDTAVGGGKKGRVEWSEQRERGLSGGGAGGGAGGAGGEERGMTVAERMMNPGREDRGVNAASASRAPVTRGGSEQGRAADGGAVKSVPSQAQGFVAELPGSKADGYESEEEIQMSATVRPGDWEMPVFV